jgi:predicted transcriptional regulator
MIRKSAAHETAETLRKRGFTYSEIARIVDVSKSTVSAWFSKQRWSQTVALDNAQRAARENRKRISLLNKARSNQYQKLYAESERSAVTEYKHYRKDALFVAGLMLYIGEGDKSTSHLIRIANSDINVHRIFISFAKAYLGVPKERIRFWLLLYPDLHEKTCVSRWSKSLGIPVAQFHKNQVIQGRSKKRTLQHGVGNTIIGGTVLKRKLSKWLELALREF